MVRLYSPVILLLANVAHCDYGEQFRAKVDNIPLPSTCQVTIGSDNTAPVLCRPAKFGDVSTIDNENSRPSKIFMDRARPMILAEPVDACDKNSLCQDDACQGKVVVVQRGTCSFYQKALNVMWATDGHAAGLIIIDSKESENGWPITMTRGAEAKSETEKWASIPVVSMMKDDGDKVMEGLQQGAEGSLHLTLATKGSWEHFENEYAIRKELQKPENHKKAELYHNLGAAISSASMSHHLDAIDAVETSYMLKNTKDSLLLLERLYEKELMYLGKAFTGCRLANYATDLNAAKKLINQAQHDYHGIDYGNVYPEPYSRHVCSVVEEYTKEHTTADEFSGKTFYEFLEEHFNPDGAKDGEKMNPAAGGEVEDVNRKWFNGKPTDYLDNFKLQE